MFSWAKPEIKADCQKMEKNTETKVPIDGFVVARHTVKLWSPSSGFSCVH